MMVHVWNKCLVCTEWKSINKKDNGLTSNPLEKKILQQMFVAASSHFWKRVRLNYGHFQDRKYRRGVLLVWLQGRHGGKKSPSFYVINVFSHSRLASCSHDHGITAYCMYGDREQHTPVSASVLCPQSVTLSVVWINSAARHLSDKIIYLHNFYNKLRKKFFFFNFQSISFIRGKKKNSGDRMSPKALYLKKNYNIYLCTVCYMTHELSKYEKWPGMEGDVTVRYSHL